MNDLLKESVKTMLDGMAENAAKKEKTREITWKIFKRNCKHLEESEREGDFVRFYHCVKTKMKTTTTTMCVESGCQLWKSLNHVH